MEAGAREAASGDTQGQRGTEKMGCAEKGQFNSYKLEPPTLLRQRPP